MSRFTITELTNGFMSIKKDTGNVYVCGDLHGMYDRFIEELDKIDFDFDNDLMIFLGDLVDRGPKSLECFNLLYKDWCISILGNHEFMCYDTLDYNYKAYVESHIHYGGQWFHDLPADVKIHISNRMRKLPYGIELNYKGKKYGFIHGDVGNSKYDWNNIKNSLRDDNYDKSTSGQIAHSVLWSRKKIESNDSIYIQNIDEVYLGHTPVNTITTLGNCHYIDTGCVFNYNLAIVKIGN